MDAEIDEAAVQNLMAYYKTYLPDRPMSVGRDYRLMLHGYHCEVMGRAHKSNTMLLDVYFGAYQITGTMSCMDPECKYVSTWQISENLTAICRPEEAAKRLHDVENDETIL